MTALVSNEHDDRVGIDILSRLPGVVAVPYDPDSSRLDERQRQAEILIPPYRSSHRPTRLITQLPRLRLVQLLSAGSDEWSSEIPAEVHLSNASGAHAGPVSEWVLSATLAQFRRWPDLVRFQDSETWAHRQFAADTLAGTRALILGAGHIGMAVARRLAVFDVSPTLVAGTAREGVHGPDALPGVIPAHATVVITAPLTAQTRGLVGTEFLARMDDGGLLVNAGRGAIVNTDALLAELSTGRLRAALDVTDPEPLPPGHPLWSAPGVLISPHSARTVPGANRLCYEVAADRVGEWLRASA